MPPLWIALSYHPGTGDVTITAFGLTRADAEGRAAGRVPGAAVRAFSTQGDPVLLRDWFASLGVADADALVRQAGAALKAGPFGTGLFPAQ